MKIMNWHLVKAQQVNKDRNITHVITHDKAPKNKPPFPTKLGMNLVQSTATRISWAL